MVLPPPHPHSFLLFLFIFFLFSSYLSHLILMEFWVVGGLEPPCKSAPSSRRRGEGMGREGRGGEGRGLTEDSDFAVEGRGRGPELSRSFGWLQWRPAAAESIPVDSAGEVLGWGLGKVEEVVGEPWAREIGEGGDLASGFSPSPHMPPPPRLAHGRRRTGDAVPLSRPPPPR